MHDYDFVHQKPFVKKKLANINAPASSLMDSIMSLKMKITEGERVGVRSLALSTSGVKGRAGAPG
jgi:ABC-type uncharacterized transport system ATPase subunit